MSIQDERIEDAIFDTDVRTVASELSKALHQTGQSEVSTRVVIRRLTDQGWTHDRATARIQHAIVVGRVRLTDRFLLKRA